MRVVKSKKWSINMFMPKLRSDILFVRIHLSFVLQDQLGWFMVWLLMWRRTEGDVLCQSSLENQLDSFCFRLRVFCSSKPINGSPFMQELLICPIHFQNSKDCKKEQKKKKSCQVSFALWKFLWGNVAYIWNCTAPPFSNPSSFFEPLLYITSRFECLWLTKESRKLMGI